MKTRLSQRATKFIPPDDLFQPLKYEVAAIGEAPAKAFVERWHYSKNFPAARRRFGLFRAGLLCGTAVFSHPVNNATITNSFACQPTEAIELGRFVLLDEVPFNGESWFFARCRELLKAEGFLGIVSFADDIPRTDAAGKVVFKGHIGQTYFASNAVYVGRGSASNSFLLPDGTLLSKRAISKVRNDESGANYVCAKLEAFTEDKSPTDQQARKEWFEMTLKRVTRRFNHPGNHKYLFPLQKGVKPLQKPLAYPRMTDNLISRFI